MGYAPGNKVAYVPAGVTGKRKFTCKLCGINRLDLPQVIDHMRRMHKTEVEVFGYAAYKREK